MSQVITYKCDVCEEGMCEATVEGSKPVGFCFIWPEVFGGPLQMMTDWTATDFHVCRDCLLMMEKTCKEMRNEGTL